jgi:uncharacterized membrane protein (UPF0127 family)
MAWLVCGSRVLASADVLSSRRARATGLIGRHGVDGAVVLPNCRWIHSVGMRFPLDVAYLDGDGTIVKIARLKPHRICAPVLQARTVIEAEAGSIGRWGLHLGDTIEVRG